MKYKRILLKLSGESLAKEDGSGIDFDKMLKISEVIKESVTDGIELGIVVGGGNFWRGRTNQMMDSCTSDYIGMLATTMNALAFHNALLQTGIEARVQTSIEMRQIAELYVRDRALKHLDKKRVVVFGCGTGSPFFSTDTAAALRAAETESEIILLGKAIDGVYSADPKLDPTATKFDKISYLDVLNKDLKVMDSTATALCKDNNIPILVFGIAEPENMVKAVMGENVGTLVE